MEGIGAKIREVRKSQKMSQEDLASRLGISRPTLIKYEKGLAEPSFDLVDMAGMVLNYDFIEDMPRTEADDLMWKYDFLKILFAKMGFTFEERFKPNTIISSEAEAPAFLCYIHIFNKDHHYEIEEDKFISMFNLCIEHMKLDINAFLKEQTDGKEI